MTLGDTARSIGKGIRTQRPCTSQAGGAARPNHDGEAEMIKAAVVGYGYSGRSFHSYLAPMADGIALGAS
jgi:hypothetical protein